MDSEGASMKMVKTFKFHKENLPLLVGSVAAGLTAWGVDSVKVGILVGVISSVFAVLGWTER